MESSNIPDLLRICQDDLDLAIDAICKLVKKVSVGKSENHKTKLLAKMQEFAKVLIQKPPLEKRTNELPSEDNVPAKKIKLDSGRKVQLPNEIWLKIMSYLKTKDLLKNFNLVCKHFKSLTLDSSAIKYIDVVKDLYAKEDYQNVVKVIKRAKCLRGISIHENYKHVTHLIAQTLKSNPNVKSIKLERPPPYLTIGRQHQNTPLSPKIIKGIMNSSVENLALINVKFGLDIASCISKMKTLKSLNIKVDSSFDMVEFLIELANNSKYLQAVELSGVFHLYEGIDTFFKSCHTLRKLKLENVFNYSDDIHNERLSLCHKLREICLNNCRQFPFNSENFYLMPELYKVSLHYTKITRNIHGKFFRQDSEISNLKYLCLEDCFPYPIEYENFLAELANQHCPNLERISVVVFGCNRANVSEAALRQLFQNCPKLKSIRLRGFTTSQLSRNFLYEIYQTSNVFLDLYGSQTSDRNKFEQCITSMHEKVFAKYYKMKSDMSNYWKCESCTYS